MDSGFISTDNPKWKQLLQNVQHDFYHLPNYLELSARYEGGKPAAFYAKLHDNFLFIPMLIRTLPDHLGVPQTWVDATSPYGYASPLFCGQDDLFLRAALQTFNDSCRQRGIITFFARLHPLLPFSNDMLRDFGQIVCHGQCVYMDLTRPEEELWRQTRNDHRNAIRKAERLGFCAEIDDWTRYDEFIDLYTETMRRIGASDFYFFSKKYFLDLKAALGTALHLCTVLSPEGDVACGALFPENNGIVQYHLSGTAVQYLSIAPTKFMLHFVRNWAKQGGFQSLHLGGGVGSQDDALFKFKAGLSKDRAYFHSFRMIVDEQRYSFLMQKTIEIGCTWTQDDDFFPVYRKLN